MVRGAMAAKAPPASFVPPIRWRRFTVWLIVGAIGMVAVLFAWHRTEEFLIQDDRFRLAEAEDFAGQSPSLTIEGVHYASPSQIRHVFAEDFGRSLYLVPIQVRRQQLLAIDWVEDATVSKLWPNALRVAVKERKPVAFVRLPSRRDGTSQFALIDHDGYILRPRTASRFRLPVMTGISEADSLSARRGRVRRVLAMLQELDALAEGVAEVNASDANDLVVTERVSGGTVQLKMGDEHFADRLRYFLASYREVKAKRPDAQTFDLRVDGNITAAGGSESGQ